MASNIKFILFFIFFPLITFGQNHKHYQPVVCTGQVPHDFFNDVNVNQLIASENQLDEDEAVIFYSKVNYEVQRYLHSGKVYFNDPFTRYLREIVDRLLVNEPLVSEKIKIYATRSSFPNAQALPDGTIFVNIGLIYAMENEDQLAFILSHEIAHFVKKHAVHVYMKNENIREEENIENPYGTLFRTLKYSRENEREADALALQRMMASDYDAGQGMQALKNMENTGESGSNLDLVKYFENNLFSIDTNWVSEKSINKWVRRSQWKESSYNLLVNTEDIYLTHPDIEKRMLAIEEILMALDYRSKERVDQTPDTQFEEIKLRASFEMVHNSHNHGKYAFSIYQSLRLLNEYPENFFLEMNIIKSLYWLCYLQEIDALDKVLVLDGLAKGAYYEKLNTFLSKPGISEYKKLSYGLLKSKVDQYKGQEEFLFYQALITEQYLGIEAAKAYYQQYSVKFPQGKQIAFVNHKLQSYP